MEEDNYIRAGGNGFFLWPRLSTLQRTEGDGDKLLMHYVPSGMKRISKSVTKPGNIEVMYLYVRDINFAFLRFFHWILEMFQKCGMFCFSF